MRILMISQFYPPTIGGQERVVADLSVELISRGHDVAVATLQHEGLPESGAASGVRVHQIASTTARFFRYSDPSRRHAPPTTDPKAVAELRRILRLEKPDVVHGHDWLVRSFLPLKRRSGPGLVVTLHDQSLVCANKRLIRGGEACTGPGPLKCLRCAGSYYGLATGPAIAVGNWAMAAGERALVDMFLPVSQAVADAAGLPARGNPHRVISNFLPARATGATEEQRLPGLPDEFILFAGDVSRDKGAAVLLEAHRLLDDPPPLILMGRIMDPGMLAPIVGPERASSPVWLAAPFGRVRAVGAQPHEVVMNAYRQCTVAVVPSVMPEGFGLVALEAMSAGRPVIASKIGGLRDIIAHGENGILVPPGDVEALHGALAEILERPALRARLGKAAQRRAEDFTADRIVPQFEQAYEDVVAARRKRSARGSGVRSFPGRAPASLGGPLRGLGSGAIQALTRLRGRVSTLAATRVAPRLRRAYADLLAIRRRRLARASVSADARRVWKGLHRPEPLVILTLTALGLAGTAIPTGGWSALRAIIVLPLVLALPGYALSGAIFRHRAPALAERIVLALSLSVVAAALVSLFIYAIRVGLTALSWGVALALVTIGATLVSSAVQAEPDDSTPGERPRAARRPWRRLPIVIATVSVGLVAGAVVLARTPLPSDSAPGYTALWLTRDRGSAKLVVGVRSEEHRRTRYVLKLVLSGRTTRRRLALGPGETWQVKLPPAARAAASLYRAGDPSVYRSVNLSAPSKNGS